MAEKLIWSAMVRVTEGPQMALSGSLDLEAYDKLAVTVAQGATLKVTLAPAGSDLQCIVINPKVPDADLSYAVGGKDIALDAPHVLLGGAVALAGTPVNLTFKNDTAVDADIDILVGRDATP